MATLPLTPPSPGATAPSHLRELPPVPGQGVQAAPAVRTRFERFELKYWVTEQQAAEIMRFSDPYLTRDPHSIRKESQRNTSLYLDTRGYRFCENHCALTPDRSKLRVRVYGEPLGKTAFFEVKRKVKTVTMKARFLAPISEVPNVLSGRPNRALIPERDRKALENFVFQMTVHRAAPKVYIGCYREAFESRIPNEDVRMTIDRELVYQPASGSSMEFEPDGRRWKAIEDGGSTLPYHGKRRALLELKFEGSAPRWMVELVRKMGLQREAFSKYTTAVRQMREEL